MEKLRSHGFCAGSGDCDHHRAPLSPPVGYDGVLERRDAADVERWSDAGLVREGCASLRSCHALHRRRCRCRPTCTQGTSFGRSGSRGSSSTRSHSSGIPPTTRRSSCSTAMRDCARTRTRPSGLLGVDRERVRLCTFARAAAEPRDDWKATIYRTSNRSLMLIRLIQVAPTSCGGQFPQWAILSHIWSSPETSG